MYKLGTHFLSLRSSAIIDHSEQLESVLVSLTDISQLIAAEQQNMLNLALNRRYDARSFGEMISRQW